MTKKLASIVLALCLCFSLVGTALAANNALTITVDPAYSGETYEAYKVFDATYAVDDTGEPTGAISYTITSSNPWYTQVNAADDVFTLTLISTDEYGVTTWQVALASDDVTGDQIVAALQPVPSDAEPVASQIADVTGSEETGSGTTTVTLDVTSGGAGYYYVTTSLGTAVAVNTAAPSVSVSDKNTPPDVRKTVDNTSEESSENHKSVEYELDIDHISGALNVVLHDKMDVSSDEVTYTFDYDNMAVYLYDLDSSGTMSRTLLTENVDYVLVKEEDESHLEDGCAFHVVFTVDGVDYDFSGCSESAYIEVVIDCDLDAVGASFEGDEFEIPNYAQVTYGNAGYSVWKEAEVYEYGFEVYKIDGQDRTALPGAHFSLTNSSGQTAYFTYESAEGIYLLEGWGEIPADTTYTSDLVTGDDGYIKIEGLDVGTYYITETQAPDGYNLLETAVEVVIATDETDPSDFTVNDNTSHIVTIENNAGSSLPSTGGMGTTIFYIIGGVLVAGAVVVLITRRRMSSNEG